MFESFKQTSEVETAMLRKLRMWIAALAAVCLLTGIGIGAILAGRPAVAQEELQAAARAPEALSASFVEVARRVEPAVVTSTLCKRRTTLPRAITTTRATGRPRVHLMNCIAANSRGRR